MTKKSGNINSRITFFSFILSVLVVYLHAENIDWYSLLENKSALAEFVKNFQWFISKDIAQAAVPGFFMLSGCLFYKNFSMTDYKSKMTSRFHSLFIPYICWNLLRLIYAFLIRNILVAGEEQVTLSLNCILESVFLYKYNQGYWYMFQLILYVVLCPAIYAIIKNKWIGAFGVLTFFLLNLSNTICDKIPVILPNSLLFYLFGSYLGRHYFKLITKEIKHPVLLFTIGTILSQIGFYFYFKTDFILFYFIFCLLFTTALFVLTAALTKTALPMFMSFSFFIYSLHGTILEVAQKILFYILPRSPFFALVEYVFLPIFTLCIIVVVAYFLQNKLPFMWRILNGARQQKKEKKAEGAV